MTIDDQPAVRLESITRESASVLEHLFELYVHDFSEFVPVDVKPDGRFHLSFSEQWWTAADHSPYFIYSGDKLAGFALVRAGSRVTGTSKVMDVAEFFVLRGARKKKVGRAAAHLLFEAFPQRWEVRVRRVNTPAIRFWLHAIEAWVGHPIESVAVTLKDVDWVLFHFDASRAATGR